MSRFEYKVVPAPKKSRKIKGIKSPEGMFSHTLQDLMNDLAERNWEYLRAEMLPSQERSGLASTTTEWRHVLIFRRQVQTTTEAFAPELLPPPGEAPGQDFKNGHQPIEDNLENDTATNLVPSETAPPNLADNGVEATEDITTPGPSLEALAASRNTDKTSS